MTLIGLSGYARSGKDEAAKVLIEEFGFTRVSFADKLRDVLYALNPIVEADFWDHSFVYLQEAIDTYGWDGYKETEYGPEIRRLLQRLGTEAGRQTLWDSIWVDAALTGLDEDSKIVVTDVRFPNEFDAIKERGGEVWRIRRTGVGPVSDHPSETSLDMHPFDRFIDNFSTLEAFRGSVVDSYAYSQIGKQ